MKALLYVLAGIAIVIVLILAPVALFPEAVVGVVDDAMTRFVDRSRLVAELNRSIDLANEGDLDQQVLIALYHVSQGEWRRQEVYEDVLGPKDRKKGEAMMRELIDAGHPEALYGISGAFDEDENAWRKAIYAGSYWAVRELHGRFVKNPCDDTLYALVDTVRTRIEDPTYPWRPSYLPESAREMRDDWKAVLVKDITLLDSVRAETCATD